MMQSPPIDPRTRADLAARVSALAEQFSGWRPPAEGSDPGTALVGVFARFAEHVLERINQAPDRAYLAFLDLIGARLLAPQPARVPLTFTLAAGSVAPALVPAGTPVGAPPTDDAPQEVVFETETTLVLGRAALRSVHVLDPSTGLHAELNDRAGTLEGGSFEVFTGTNPLPQQLFLSTDPLTEAGPSDLVLTLSSTHPQLWTPERLSWAYFDGTLWQPITAGGWQRSATTGEAVGTVQLTLLGVPTIAPHEVNGVRAAWLRAQSEVAIPTEVSTRIPEAVAVGRRAPQPPVAGLAPFGEAGAATWFYLNLHDPRAAGARAHLSLALQTPGLPRRGSGPEIAWSYRAGGSWKPLGRSGSRSATLDDGGFAFTDGSLAFSTDGEIGFAAPPDWQAGAFNGSYGHWLRAELTNVAQYQVQPVLASLQISYELPLAQLSAVRIGQAGSDAPTAPTRGLLNGAEIDLSKDFRPFGERPAFNDTLHLAVPADIAAGPGPLTLAITLTNPKGRAGTGPLSPVSSTPTISWETYDGTGWRPAAASRADAFTTSGDLTLTPAAAPAQAEVAGQRDWWVRARLVGGDYGQPASYRPADPPATGYVPVPATLAAPIVAGLRWRPGPPQAQPPAACLSRVDFAYSTRWSDPAGALSAAPFAPFPPAADPDPALYLGFDRPFDPAPVTVYLAVQPPPPAEVTADRLAEFEAEVAPDVVWEYWNGAGWQLLDAIDLTGTFADPGLLQFTGPQDVAARELFGENGFWLRGRWRGGDFPVRPKLRGILLNTTWASQASSIEAESLGAGTANPGQVVSVAVPPVLPGARLQVREGEDWLDWSEVPDLYSSGPEDRHFTLDPLTGLIGFGDGRAGRLPTAGQSTIRISYRSGGGPAGNRPPGTITELKATLPSVDTVRNHESSTGGAPAEEPSRLAERGPATLRHSYRAIAAADLEDLAYEATPEVARAKAIPADGYDPYSLWLDPAAPVLLAEHAAANAGRAGVIVVPRSADARPTPALGLLNRVRDFLAARGSATAGIWVAGPEWLRVSVSVLVVASTSSAGASGPGDAVQGAVQQALQRYLHPLTGGSDSQGWAFGRKPHRSDLFALIAAVEGVDHVVDLQIALEPEDPQLAVRISQELARPLADGRAPAAVDLQRWLGRCLVYSGRHDVSLSLRG